MSARGFGSVLSAGAVVGAALGFYLVSLRVASERAALEDVETQIALAQRDIRLLQTEIGTRGRLAQLERWNVKFIRLSAPKADQFVEGGFQLATLVAPRKRPAIDAPVVLAAAPMPANGGEPRLTGDADLPGAAAAAAPQSGQMLHLAGYGVPDHRPAADTPARPAKSPAKVSTATKPVKTATADPLAPLPADKHKAKGSAPGAFASSPKQQTKDSDSD